MANGYESGGYFVGLIIITCILLVEFRLEEIPLALWICLGVAICVTCAAALYKCRKAGDALAQQPVRDSATRELPPYFITGSNTTIAPRRTDPPPTYTAATLGDLPPPTYTSAVRGANRPPTQVKQRDSDNPPPSIISVSTA